MDNAPMPTCPMCGSPIPKPRRVYCSKRCQVARSRRAAKVDAAVARSLGRCRGCGADSDDKAYCPACAAAYDVKVAGLRKRWRAAGLCVRCGRIPEAGYANCALCRAYLAAWRATPKGKASMRAGKRRHGEKHGG